MVVTCAPTARTAITGGKRSPTNWRNKDKVPEGGGRDSTTVVPQLHEWENSGFLCGCGVRNLMLAEGGEGVKPSKNIKSGGGGSKKKKSLNWGGCSNRDKIERIKISRWL